MFTIMPHTLHMYLYTYIQLSNFILFQHTHSNTGLNGCCDSGPGVGHGHISWKFVSILVKC